MEAYRLEIPKCPAESVRRLERELGVSGPLAQVLVRRGLGEAAHARSFLDVRVEGVPRRMDGKTRSVWVVQRDFRSVQGLMMSFVLETIVDGYPQTHKIVVEKVAVNPKLDAATFAKPKA